MGESFDRSDAAMRRRVEGAADRLRLQRMAESALDEWLAEGGERRQRAWAVRNKLDWKRPRHNARLERVRSERQGVLPLDGSG